MATFNKYNQFLADLCNKVHNLGADTLKIMLSNTAPNASTHAVRTDATELSTANGYTSGGVALTGVSSAQSGGTYTLKCTNDPSWTASGGSMATFRYAILYNDTPTSPVDPLIGYWDYGSAVTLATGETFTVDLDPTNGIFQLA